VSGWLIATPIVATIVVVVAVLILTSGSSGTGDVEAPPDPRVAGQTPASTVSLNVDNINFSQTELSGNAGEVIEFVVTNTSPDRSHTMVFAGPDNRYETSDDFKPQPLAIKEGETGRVAVKFDDPGVYLFRCAFHPDIEFGTLSLQ
jgi:plastocyanin